MSEDALTKKNVINALYAYFQGAQVDEKEIADFFHQHFIVPYTKNTLVVDYAHSCFLTEGELLWDFVDLTGNSHYYDPAFDKLDCFYKNSSGMLEVTGPKSTSGQVKEVLLKRTVVPLVCLGGEWKRLQQSGKVEGLLICREEYQEFVSKLSDTQLESVVDDFLLALNRELKYLTHYRYQIKNSQGMLLRQGVVEGVKKLATEINKCRFSRQSVLFVSGPVAKKIVYYLAKRLTCYVVWDKTKRRVEIKEEVA